MPPLPASLTDLPGRFLRLLERKIEPRLQSLLCDYTTYVPLPTLHETITALSDTMGTTLGHLCDTLALAHTGRGALCCERPTSHAYYQWRFAVSHCRCEDCHGGTDHYPLPGGHGSVSSAFGFGIDRRRYLSGAAPEVEPLLRTHSWKFVRARLRQLLGLTEADQSPEFRGTQYSKLVAGGRPHFIAVTATALVTVDGVAQEGWGGAMGGHP